VSRGAIPRRATLVIASGKGVFIMKRSRCLGKTKTPAFLFGMLAAMLTIGTTLFAQSAESDFEVALTDDGNGVVIKRYTGKATKTITIPATIEGLPVREIGEMAFIGVGTVSDYMGVMKTDVSFAVVLP
jgi:hypothetical protein